jgi:Plasmid pRiA4b ORF-3-like protein
MTQPNSNQEPEVQIYQFHALILKISPAISRRLLLRSDNTLADLHYALQIAFDWSDTYLHKFKIHANEYSLYRPGGFGFEEDGHQVKLSDFQFRLKEHFTYHYNFFDDWRVQIRLEQILPLVPKKQYPVCIGGSRLAPEEDCGGVEAFMTNETAQALGDWEDQTRLAEIMVELLKTLKKSDAELSPFLTEHRPEIKTILAKVEAAKFSRAKINQQLKHYAEKGLEGFFDLEE